jgi:hypothetical protein
MEFLNFDVTQITDGLLGESPEYKSIATLTPMLNIDKALLRKGRLSIIYNSNCLL